MVQERDLCGGFTPFTSVCCISRREGSLILALWHTSRSLCEKGTDVQHTGYIWEDTYCTVLSSVICSWSVSPPPWCRGESKSARRLYSVYFPALLRLLDLYWAWCFYVTTIFSEHVIDD